MGDTQRNELCRNCLRRGSPPDRGTRSRTRRAGCMGDSPAARPGDRPAVRWPRAVLLPRPAELLRRPAEPVERVRWLFALSALSALFLTPIGMLADGDRWTTALVAVSCSGLACSWVHRYRTREVPLVLDLTDTVCL